MAKKLKINFQQTQTIREAFADFLLQKSMDLSAGAGWKKGRRKPSFRNNKPGVLPVRNTPDFYTLSV